MSSKRLTVAQRKDIFRTLVATQDAGAMSVTESMDHVAKQYRITEKQLRSIQEEGIDKEWPPLDEEAVQAIGA